MNEEDLFNGIPVMLEDFMEKNYKEIWEEASGKSKIDREDFFWDFIDQAGDEATDGIDLYIINEVYKSDFWYSKIIEESKKMKKHNEAESLYEDAQQEYMGGDYQVAIKLLNEAIKLNPSDGCFYYERGQAKDELEDFNGAVEDFTRALSFDPDESLLGNCLHARANTRFFGLNDKNGACDDWSKAAAMGRENSAEYLKEHCQ